MAMLTENLILQKTKVDNLDKVKNLNLWGSELTDVALLAQLQTVEVLALSVNKITTLRDVAGCRSLKELYLRKNEIAELSEVLHLAKLPNLTVLWLCENPCANHPLYRIFTIRCCPKLVKLDNVEVSPQERLGAERMTTDEVQSCVGGKVLGSVTGGAPKAGNVQMAPVAAPPLQAPLGEPPKVYGRRGSPPPLAPQANAPLPPVARGMAQDGSSATSSSSRVQRGVMASIVALLPLLTPDSLASLQLEIARIQQQQ